MAVPGSSSCVPASLTRHDGMTARKVRESPKFIVIATWDRGRSEAVLIMLDRAFELLLKAIIVHRGGSIRETRKAGTTIGFDMCLRKCLSDAAVKCLSEDDAVALQTLNTLRDAAQHHIIEVSEELLYVNAQAAVTLFSRLGSEVLGLALRSEIPPRILPVCARPPRNLGEIFDAEFADIKNLVAPGSRKRLDAHARLRAMAVLQASLDGRKSQATEQELEAIVRQISAGRGWRDIFPGVSCLTIDTQGEGPSLVIPNTKKKSEALKFVKDGDPSATVVAVHKVNELDFYNLGLKDLARKLKRTPPKLLRLIEHDGIQDDPECFKSIRIGKQTHKRYSATALDRLARRVEEIDLDRLWTATRRERAT